MLLGFGAINRRVLELLKARESQVEIAGIIARQPTGLEASGIPTLATAAQLVAAEPDMVLEAASREAVREWGGSVLRAARRFVVSSSSAFADEALLDSLRAVAKAEGSQIVLSPGAIGGVDALSAAARAGLHEVRHRIIKHPSRWGQSAVGAQGASSDSAGPIVLFRGSARVAADRYPLNANVTVVTAMAGLGLDRTIVELIADPSSQHNRHELHVSGACSSFTLAIENYPLASNPKSSEQAALALVRLAENDSADFAL